MTRTPLRKRSKEKKSNTNTKLTSETDPDGSNTGVLKKRKALEINGGDNAEEEEESGTSSEMGELMNSSKKKKKMKFDKKEEEKEENENPNAVSNFRISEPLKEKGIEFLFPIQAMTFDAILEDSDLVGRARTGEDHIERGNIDFSALKSRVLDEGDENAEDGFR